VDAMIASANIAQPRSAPSLLGTWRLVSFEALDSKGERQFPLGKQVSGQLVYDAAGNMSAHVMRNDVPASPPTILSEGQMRKSGRRSKVTARISALTPSIWRGRP